MVQLDHLIQQAKSRRRINDLFKTREEGLAFRPEALDDETIQLDRLLGQLELVVTELHYQDKALADNMISELEDIVSTLD